MVVTTAPVVPGCGKRTNGTIFCYGSLDYGRNSPRYSNKSYCRLFSERSSSSGSRRSMLIERYPPSKYTKDLGGDMFISPPSDKSGSTFSESADPRDYKVFESLLRDIYIRRVQQSSTCDVSSTWHVASACLATRAAGSSPATTGRAASTERYGDTSRQDWGCPPASTPRRTMTSSTSRSRDERTEISTTTHRRTQVGRDNVTGRM